MGDIMTVRGFVATDPRTNTTHGGDVVSSFRLAATERRFDREAGAWVDGHTNWYTVVGFRQLAGNMSGSLKKGQRVIVVGRLRLKQWEKDGRIFHSAEVEAESVGHDLFWGSAKFSRNQQDAQRSEAPIQRVVVDGVGVVDLRTGEVPDDEASGENEHDVAGLADDGTDPRADPDDVVRLASEDAGTDPMAGARDGLLAV
ncbi:single-stranded DNA-binding protein [Sinomonas sp. JGH33]|uniref:Single-stranded DNA-binding protein n=1 Tax=Sinomonas terricola TaxID=3110330 RepID=A0ABU5T6I7_9MICC|nr:single-stranded DNA-binding protein [Sinomonas sp. JGH33]MEA5455296.1 single-stranded DNA-binding protein [Sinomonas sp. JGH33]